MLLGARRGVGAAAGERGQHLEAVLDQPSADGRAHHAGRDDCNDGIHACILQFIGSESGWHRYILLRIAARLGKGVGYAKR